MVAEQYRAINPGYNPDNPPGRPKLAWEYLREFLEKMNKDIQQLLDRMKLVEENMTMLRVDLTAAALTAGAEIAAIRKDGQKQLDELKEEIHAVRERLIMVVGAGNKI